MLLYITVCNINDELTLVQFELNSKDRFTKFGFMKVLWHILASSNNTHDHLLVYHH